MSYIYLQARGEESSAANYSDIPRYVLSKLKSTRDKSYSKGKETECFQDSQSGMMCVHSMEPRGEVQLTLFVGDFPVKTLAFRGQTTEKNLEFQESVRDYGWSIKELLKKFNLDLCLLKTRQHLKLEDLSESSKTLMSWGMMQDGVLSGLATSLATTKEIDSGCLPTVLATDWKGGTTAIRKDKNKQRFDQWRDYVKILYGMTYPHPTHSELRMGWPEGWTDLGPLEMGKYRKWRHSHG